MEFFNRFFGSKKDGELEGGSSEEEKKKAPAKKVDPSRRDFLKFAAGAAGTFAVERIAGAANGKKEGVQKETKESLLQIEQKLADSYDQLLRILDESGDKILGQSAQKLFPHEKFDKYSRDALRQVLLSLTPEERDNNRVLFLHHAKSACDIFFNSLESYFNTMRGNNVDTPHFETKNKVYWSKMSEQEWNELPEGEKPAGCERYTTASGKTMYAIHDVFESSNLLELFEGLKKFDCHGLMYQSLARVGKYAQAGEILGDSRKEWEQGRMTYRTAEFLPTAERITNEEIDPFLSFSKEKGYQYAEKYKPRSKWGKNEYQNKFRKVLSNKQIRGRLMQQPGFTHADSCSLIKAVIEYQERGLSANLSEEEVFEKILEERHVFEQEVWIDPETHMIRLYGVDTKKGKEKNIFDRSRMDQVVKAVGCKQDTIFEAEKTPDADDEFLKAVQRARGKTCIYVETHGDEVDWSLGEGTGSVVIDEFAGALMEVVFTTLRTENLQNAYRSIGAFKLLAEPCLGYDFLFKNLVPEMRKVLTKKIEAGRIAEDLLQKIKKDPSLKEKFEATDEDIVMANKDVEDMKILTQIDFNKIDLPRVIAHSQEGNVAYGPILEKLASHHEAFKKLGKLRGKDLLAIQSEVYPVGGDMSFSGSKDGKMYQISELEQEQAGRAV